MNKFMELLLESTLIQGVVTLMLLGVICYLAVVSQPIPELLVNGTMLVLGFWFGSKGVQAARSAGQNR